ncbi:MAG: RluA family pseudouridine synthase, partial [Treponema sp.]|nr:RluA family pseudouridine synthase [Treponema sp.]
MKSEKIPIIYEDSEIFVINKRQGLAVQGGAGISHSVDSDFAAQVGQKIYLVHRLDKETSGLLLCAKSPSAAAKWTRVVGEKNAEKEYKALCLGAMENPRGKISSDISERGAKKRAETFYETEKIFEIPWESFG